MLAGVLLWARANPKVVAWTFLVVATLLVCAALYRSIYHRGAEQTLRKIEHQNEEAHRAADQAGSRVDQCYRRDGMRWDYPRGECVRAEGDTR